MANRRSACREVLLRVHRLTVVTDLEVDHVAVRTGAAHLGDLLTGLHALPFIHQALAVVAIGRQPLVAVLDDDQLAVANQAGAEYTTTPLAVALTGWPLVPAMSTPCLVASPAT